MAFDEEIAARVRRLLASRHDVEERRMFGGIAFMVGGHMACGIVKNQLMVRVGPEAYEDALHQPHAREMNLTGKPMRGFVMLDPEGLTTAQGLDAWVEKGVSFVSALPPK